MSPPIGLTDRDLAERVRSACASYAEHIVAGDAPFDPNRTTTFASQGERPPSEPDPRHRALAAALVLVLVGTLAAALVVVRNDATDGVVTDRTTTTEPGPPDGRPLVPRVAPLGLPVERVEDLADDRTATAARTQLFLTDGGLGRVLVEVRPPAAPPGGQPIVVRGVRGTSTTAAATSVGLDTIRWNERGEELQATSSGLIPEDVVALLGGLRWRGRDPLDGFARPVAGNVVLSGEVGRVGPPRRVTVVYEQRYEDGGDGRRVSVTTWSGIAGQARADSLRIRLEGDPVGSGPHAEMRSYDLTVPVLRIARADGRVVQVQIESDRASVADVEPLLDRIASDLRPIDADRLAVLERQIDRRLEGLPRRVVQATTDGTSLELRGGVTDMVACIVVRSDRRCEAPVGDVRAASTVVDGRWSVGVIAPGPVAILSDGSTVDRDLTGAVGTMPPPFASQGWAVADVPEDVDRVLVRYGGASFVPLQRPRG